MHIFKFMNKQNRLFSYSRIRRYLSTQVQVDERPLHVPVMVHEVIKYLKPQNKQTIIDMTFGAGGHTQSILDENYDVTIIALDRDQVSHERAIEMAESYPNKIIPLLGKFSELPDLLRSKKIYQNTIDGILFDFGCSSMQFDTANRGFSVSKDGPLDMRMDGDRFPDSFTARDILARGTEDDLGRIFKIYGEEKNYKKIARAIIESRYLFRNLNTTKELCELVDSICEDEVRFDMLNRPAHNATKIFQALRIFVNDELNEINQGMHIASQYLKIGGRLITIAFHSLEDTIVKRHITGHITGNVANALPLKYCDYSMVYQKEFAETFIHKCWHSLTKHVIVPSDGEVKDNPRSRSARLRAAVKIK
ncbi:putative methyltransferase-like protein 15 homolog [Arctopsyche grandis]|uniref:putative methyltransferase-like protein 15 homolog n=1 Tax=Arctopsyche grandis TaxID=121162 RepID=UPI00406D720C